MDGSDPDSGTAWEIGYAYAKGTPIILLRTDFREWGGRTGDAPYNLMLTESATEHIELARADRRRGRRGGAGRARPPGAGSRLTPPAGSRCRYAPEVQKVHWIPAGGTVANP